VSTLEPSLSWSCHRGSTLTVPSQHRAWTRASTAEPSVCVCKQPRSERDCPHLLWQPHWSERHARLPLRCLGDGRERPAVGSLMGAVVAGCVESVVLCGALTAIAQGIAVLLETARLFGVMFAQGWRPQRDVVFAAWDGEEYALLGSTHYVDVNSPVRCSATLSCSSRVLLCYAHCSRAHSLSSACRPSRESYQRTSTLTAWWALGSSRQRGCPCLLQRCSAR
jgi:hypothetical protein